MSFNSPFTGQVIQPTDVSYRSITLSADSTLSWPINGSDTDNAAARVMDVSSLSSGLVLAGVTVTGTAGQCSCTTTPSLFVGQAIVVTGVLTGTATGIVSGNTYYIILTNGTTTFTLSATSGGTAVATTAGTTTGLTFTLDSFTLDMPPANQASVGIDALFRNVGSYSFEVRDYAGGSIVTIAAGEAKYIYLTTNATTAGTWGLIAFGVGTSNVDAATLAGYGLKAISNTLNAANPVNTFGSNYTALTTDRASTYVWTGGSGTLALTAVGALVNQLGNDWYMMVRNGGTGTLTIAPVSGLINGASTIALQPADSCVICCSGSAFFTVGLGRSTEFNFTQLTKAVAASNTYTLTASEAANTVQKYTGTGSGNVSVVLPQTVQVYYITNQTSGLQITFTTSGGGGTAIVPASQQVILLCDSINLLNASTIAAGAVNISLVDGSVGGPALNFQNEINTGIYRPTSEQFGIAILGVQLLRLTGGLNPGLNVPGTGNFTGGVQGGTF